MKKICLTILALLFFASSSFAAGEKYYEYKTNLDVKFIPSDNISKSERKEYKKILKNEKYITKKKYEKAEKLLPDFIPNVARFINIYTDKKDFPKALQYALKLKELDKTNLFPQHSKDYRIGILYSQNGDYLNSNKILHPYIKTDSWALFQVAQNFYYMQDLKTSEQYAVKITPKCGAYFSAQELLYTIYNITKNAPKAYTAAKNLIKLDRGNPQNYLKLANVTTNNTEKLINYYRAKRIYYSQGLNAAAAGLNGLIAPLEQQKIDNAYKKLSTFCKKPDGNKIKTRNKNLLADDIEYWDNRQTEFFETANDCISRYKGSNLAACFNDINITQEKLDKELLAENARRIEKEQREAQIMLLMKQNALLEEQNRMQWMRYNYYYPRYYYGWWW